MLSKNSLLEEITVQLSTNFPLQEAIQVYQRSHKDKPPVLNHITGEIAEIGIGLRLASVCSSYGNRIDLNSIASGVSTDNYHFMKNKHEKLLVLSKDKSTPIGDLDATLVVDSLPAIVEVTILRTGSGRNRRKRKGWGLSGLGPCRKMKDEHLQRILPPVQEYFQTEDVGYVLIVLPEVIKANPVVQNEFQQKGGILLPFYTTSKIYRQEISRIMGIQV